MITAPSLKAGLLTAALSLPLAVAAHGSAPAPAAAAPAAAQQTQPSAQTTTAAVRTAPPMDLRVTYYTLNVGQDGVQREATHTNRVYRRTTAQGAWVWTERELPATLRNSQLHGHEHRGPHAGHAHDEASGAPLRVIRADSGQETVEVILEKLRRVIEVERAHYGNVGYGGSWDTQYWLVPPAALRAMRPVGAAKNGVQRYQESAGEQSTMVDWDVRGQYPRLIERRDGHGTSLTRVKTERIAAPNPPPWAASEKFERGDYSDLLD